MLASSRTPEGSPGHCSLCGRLFRIEPSVPLGDAACPHCGSLVWIGNPLVPSRRTVNWIGYVRLAFTMATIVLLLWLLVWRSGLAGADALLVFVAVILLFGRRLASWATHSLTSTLLAAGVFFGPTLAVFGQDTKVQQNQIPVPATEFDIPYAAGGDQQKLDLFLPAKKGFTSVVFTYGGGWHTGSRKAVAAIGKKFQAQGFGCALLSHRLAPKDKFPAQIEDVAAGFAWVKRNIASRGGEPQRVFLMGHSSGAHLSLLLATDGQYLAKHKLAPADIAGVIGLSSPVDLEPQKNGKSFGDVLLAGRGADVFSRNPETMKNASPIQHVTSKLPPTLLVVGERDFPMLASDATVFVEKANKSGAVVSLYLAKARDHMGVVQSLIRDSDPVLEQVLHFIRNTRIKDKS